MSLRRLLRASIVFVVVGLVHAESSRTETSVTTAALLTSTPSPTLLPSPTQSPATVDNLPAIEVDFIFPRNESYVNTTFIPIAINVQHYQYYADLPDGYDSIEFDWGLQPYSLGGRVPGGVGLDGGKFVPYSQNSTPSNSTVWISYTNITQWARVRLEHSDRFMLTVWAYWNTSSTGVCPLHPMDADFRPPISEVMFSLEKYTRDLEAVNTSLPDAPDCPVFGAILKPVAIPTESTTFSYFNPTSERTVTCSGSVVVTSASGAGTPCSATVDATVRAALDSAISSKASVDYASSYASMHPPTTSYSTKSPNAAPAMATAMPLGPALAAAGVVYGMIH